MTKEIKKKKKLKLKFSLKKRKLYKRFFIRNREHVGLKTIHNLYWMHPILRLRSKGTFIGDDTPEFSGWLDGLKEKKYKKILLLGNAPSLNDMTDEQFDKLKKAGYLTVGVNRAIFKFQTDILMWTDLLTMDDILKKRAIKSDDTQVLYVKLERDHRYYAAEDKAFQGLWQYWSQNKNFTNWKKTKLFMFRNIAVAAMHLSYKLGIKEVLMVGFGFDDRGYFYQTDKYKEAKEYEVLNKKKLDMNCGGYDTHKIVGEVLTYLLEEENFDIQYCGKSNFLSNLGGMKNVKLEDVV